MKFAILLALLLAASVPLSGGSHARSSTRGSASASSPLNAASPQASLHPRLALVEMSLDAETNQVSGLVNYRVELARLEQLLGGSI